jgi:quinol monooxygenase YgiN
MYLRLTSFKVQPDKVKEAKLIFQNEVMPVLRNQKGNRNILLLEPVDLADDFISMTQWDSKKDADAYHDSGTYRQLVNKLDGLLTKQPVLKVYTVEEALITTSR